MSIKLGASESALRGQRYLAEATTAVSKASERLASGLRINRSADDAAGLSISSSLNSSARVYGQAVRNLNDGISYLTIADSAVSSLKDLVTRAKELGAQAANGVYSPVQRSSLQAELGALSDEYDRIVSGTSFNGQQIFNRANGNLTIQAGYGSEAALSSALDLSSWAVSGRAFSQPITTPYAGSTDSSGILGNNASLTNWFGNRVFSTSASGRYVVYQSAASNLTAADTNSDDIFLKDLITGQTTMVNVSSQGVQGNGGSYHAAISADGQFVAFDSGGNNLVSGDTTSGFGDIFVRDVVNQITTRVSVSTAGAEANGNSYQMSISGDGRYVTYTSAATNLISTDSNGVVTDIFVRDTLLGTTSLVSANSAGTQASAASTHGMISDSGRYVVFQSTANNLAAGDGNAASDVFVRDLQTGTTTAVSVDGTGTFKAGSSTYGSISSDGRYVTFTSTAALIAEDTNGVADIYMRDMVAGTIERISVSSSGAQSNGASDQASVSADGRYIAYHSAATNLVGSDANGATHDVFLYDRTTRQTALVSVSSSGVQGNALSSVAFINSEGNLITFSTNATNLLPGDGNGQSDVVTVSNPFMAGANGIAVNVTSQREARFALDVLDTYLAQLNSLQGGIGASMARFEVAANNLGSLILNTTAAASRITDIDVADESATLLAATIRQQVATSLLSHSNQAPRISLELLKNI